MLVAGATVNRVPSAVRCLRYLTSAETRGDSIVPATGDVPDASSFERPVREFFGATFSRSDITSSLVGTGIS